MQADYVPSSFRFHRLAAVKRLSKVRAATNAAAITGVVETLRGAAAADSDSRPSAAALLAAIVKQQQVLYVPVITDDVYTFGSCSSHRDCP